MVNEAQGGKRWQSGTRSFQGGIAHISKDKEFADVKFTVGTRTFKAHRLILAARSHHFSRMLMKEGAALPVMTNIDIHDVSEEAFEILLNFLYTDIIPKMESQDLVLDVYHAANLYEMQKLRETCEKLIAVWEMTCDTVIPMLQMTDVQFVRNRCWEYLRMHAKEVLNSNGILTATSDTIALMFERGCLSGIPTIELLHSVVRWAEKQYRRRDGDYVTVRQHLLSPNCTSKSLMKWLDFEKLTPPELGQVISKYPNLLTDEEVRILFQYSFAPEDNRPELPNW